MTVRGAMYATVEYWIAREARPFSVDSPQSFNQGPRAPGARYRGYAHPLMSRAFTDFDWLAVLDTTGYNRGRPPLQAWDATSEQQDLQPLLFAECQGHVVEDSH